MQILSKHLVVKLFKPPTNNKLENHPKQKLIQQIKNYRIRKVLI
jgi:hypothetical protein